MVLSVSLFLFIGVLSNILCKKLNMPGLVGMIFGGILIGPYLLNLIDVELLDISAQLRKIALVIILIRAGLTLNLDDLRKVGISAILMCFVPASLEIIGTLIIAPLLLHVSYLEALLLGSVLAAVSPAVIVPKMIELIETGKGTDKSIPQLILAGASIDDIFVIVLFYAFLSLNQGESVSLISFINIPVSIILGILIGIVSGYLISLIFKHVKMSIMSKVLLFLGLSLLLVYTEDNLDTAITFSGLIAVMFIGMSLKKFDNSHTENLTKYFNAFWSVAEIFLFILVGAEVNLQILGNTFFIACAAVLLILVFRAIGVIISLSFTNYTFKEKLFCIISYTPKATVQAAIGGIPLSLGLSSGNIILIVAIIAILLTAPIGSYLINKFTYLIE